MSFIEELKRRNVFRVAIAYTVAAWLIIQVAGQAADSFGAPDWVMKMLITLLVLVAPVALIMAWAYEMTPDGLRRDTGEQPLSSATGKLNRTITIALVVALGYFVVDKFVLDPQRDAELLESASQSTAAQAPAEQAPVTPAQEEDTSIAVLSFVNMSDDASNEYFSDGLSEELLNLLVKIPELRVAARTSSFSFKDKDVKISQIGEELNVTYVLEGSVRKAGDQIRVTAQLIKADDGFHLWSQTFDRTLDDIFAMQDEIAVAVVSALKVTLLGAIPEQRQTDPEAYALFLQARHFSRRRTEDDLHKSVELLQQALAIDPEFAPAWVDLHYSYSLLNQGNQQGTYDPSNAVALEALNTALELDNNLADAWSALAYHKRSIDWDWAGASAAIDKAIQLEPNNANVLGSAASIASTFGQLDKSIELFERNVAVDPLRHSSRRALANRYRAVGRFEEALREFNIVKELNPDYPNIDADIGFTLLHMGEYERALEIFERVGDPDRLLFAQAITYFDKGEQEKSQAAVEQLAHSPRLAGTQRMIILFGLLEDNDAVFKWLEMAYENHDASLVFLLLNNLFLPTVTIDPRWPVFLEKMGLREYWEAMPPEYGGPAPK